jgi:hypothetical protein
MLRNPVGSAGIMHATGSTVVCRAIENQIIPGLHPRTQLIRIGYPRIIPLQKREINSVLHGVLKNGMVALQAVRPRFRPRVTLGKVISTPNAERTLRRPNMGLAPVVKIYVVRVSLTGFMGGIINGVTMGELL